jgi:hypothetical protein
MATAYLIGKPEENEWKKCNTFNWIRAIGIEFK